MYLPRSLISHLYQNLLRIHHPLSPPLLLLVALEPDALCACRILTALLKRDYIQHKIQPISGYGDLASAGETLVKPMRKQHGGTGGVVVCLGVGGLVDLATVLGLQAVEEQEDPSGGVEVWLIDARRPWNLGNVFGGNPANMMPSEMSEPRGPKHSSVKDGRIEKSYKPGQGGIIVYDDGDIDEYLANEREAYCELVKMPDIGDDNEVDSDLSGTDGGSAESDGGDRPSKKRKSWSNRDADADDGEEEDGRPHRRRRSNSVGGCSSRYGRG